MNRNALVALTATTMAFAAAVPLKAQNYRFDIGINGGASTYTPLLDDKQLGEGTENVKFKGNWLTGAQATLWVTPMIGIRANGTYTDTKLKQGDVVFANDVNLWSGSGDLMFRFKRPRDSWQGFEALPYVALGAGAKWVNPAGDHFFVTNEDGKAVSGVPFGCTAGVCFGPGGVPTAASNVFFLREKSSFMGLGALGADLRVAPSFAVRLEAGDRIYKPNVVRVATAGFPGGVTATSGENVARTVHEIYGQLGLHMLLGLQQPTVVAAAPAPPPPVETPAPAPAPTTESVDVCVVDPTATGGLRTVTATHNLTTNDTTVMVNGTSLPLSQSVGTVPVASNATWYVQGQPLVIGSGRTTVRYVAFGSPRMITASDLTYLGTVNGLPVYADRNGVSGVVATTAPGDISMNVNQNRAYFTGLENVSVLYVPMQSTGCVFQPVQIQQQVRKSGR
jgi:hypothetical protein